MVYPARNHLDYGERIEPDASIQEIQSCLTASELTTQRLAVTHGTRLQKYEMPNCVHFTTLTKLHLIEMLSKYNTRYSQR